MTTHYHNESDTPEKAFCGSVVGEFSKSSPNWGEVDCQRCVRNQERIMGSVEQIENDIIDQMGRMTDLLSDGNAIAVKALFVPLKAEYYLKFENGLQDCEIRPDQYRGWSRKNVYPGRPITLSYGYGKQRRISKIITCVAILEDLSTLNIPEWHIEAVYSIYGDRKRWLVAFLNREPEPDVT